MMKQMEFIAPCHFGLESVLRREIQNLGYEVTLVEDGKVTFEAEEEIPWTLDGEYGGDHSDVVIENLNKAIEIMVKERHLKELSIEGKQEEN